MKRVIIFSDTHGYTDKCVRIIKNTIGVDAIIHAGDSARDAQELMRVFPDIPVYYVRGNNDFLSSAPDYREAVVGGKRIVIVHGHIQRVKYDMTLSSLKSLGEKARAELVVFGHTHVPRTEYSGKMTIINPGSLTFSGTYAVAEIENGVLKTAIIES